MLGSMRNTFETRLRFVARSVFMAKVRRDWDCEHLDLGRDIMNRPVTKLPSPRRVITMVRT